MRVKTISVRGLFSLFNHTIHLNMDDRITIVHGPNGFGKTALLTMIDAFFRSRDAVLSRTSFDEFSIHFDDDTSLVVTRDRQASGVGDRAQLTWKRLGPSGAESEDAYVMNPPSMDARIRPAMLRDLIPGIIPDLIQVGPAMWRLETTGEILDQDEMLDRFAHLLPLGTLQPTRPPSWLTELQSTIKTRFIQTQRLVHRVTDTKPRYNERTRQVSSVQRYSEDLVTRVNGVIKDYADLSQRLDRSFPERLFRQSTSENLSVDGITAKLRALETKRARLMEAGLLDQEELNFQVPEVMDPTKLTALSVYVGDVETKLGVFDEIAAKLELMKSSINRRFLYKQLSISRDDGFTFTAEPDRKHLNPLQLSSGEQHEMVLLYDLLFQVESNSLVLIDEPEISLHLTTSREGLR